MTSRPNPPHTERANRLLTQEGAAGSAEQCATAAVRIYDKLHTHLAPLIGTNGVDALFVRSAKLARTDFSFLDASCVESTAKLHACFLAQEPAVASESAALLLGTFFALITTFIGERLTSEVLRSAWPTIVDTGTMEKRK